MAKSLKARIDELIDALGSADKPTLPQIRSRLFKFAALAQELEQSKAVRKAEAKNVVLQAQIEALQVQFDEARSQIKEFRAEEKEREKQEAELPEIQFKILKGLPLVNQHSHGLDRIAWAAGIPMDEAEIYLDVLCKRKPPLARKCPAWPFLNETGWKRTMAGNRYVFARRLAGEEEEQKAYRYADLPKIQHEALLRIAAGQGAGASESHIAEKLGITFGSTRYAFNALREGDFAADPFEQENPGADRTFYLRAAGAEYLNERGLL